MQENNYKDISLFYDIEDPVLRARNRGVVMGNLTVDGIDKSGKMTPRATKDLLEYFKRVPADERKPALQVYLDYLKQEGYAIESSPFVKSSNA